MTVDSTRLRDGADTVATHIPTGPSRRTPRSARIRRVVLAIVLAEIVIFGVGFAIFGRGLLGSLRAEPPVGTDLGGVSAPDFALTDQAGRAVALSELRGKAVVLTFLYTSCPDTCPIIASRLGVVHDRLGDRARGVAFAAIAVDPERDTVERGRQFLEAQGVGDKLLFLTADRPTLESVWAAYYIGVTRLPVSGPATARNPEAYSVAHNDVLYLIDKQGQKRRLLREDFEIDDMVAAVRMLVDE